MINRVEALLPSALLAGHSRNHDREIMVLPGSDGERPGAPGLPGLA
ncbi:hypothetical protein [Corynebacterium sp. H128]